MVKLFYGEDSYLLNSELKKIEVEFSNNNFGDINISKFDGGSIDLNQLISAASALPFLAPKRLVIVKNLFHEGKDDVKEYINENFSKFPDTSMVILVEDWEVPKNLAIYKKLAKTGSIEHFPLRKGYELEKWLVQIADEKKIPIKLPAIKKLVLFAGSNSARLVGEIEKLDLYRKALGKTEIESVDIEEMVSAEQDQNIFDFIDALGARNSRLAIKYLENLFVSGKNENYVLSMIVWGFRNMLIVSDLIVRGVKRNQIPKESELHPFVVGKTIRVLNNFDLPLLKRIYSRLLQTDLEIKTGGVEPRLALEKLLADLTI